MEDETLSRCYAQNLSILFKGKFSNGLNFEVYLKNRGHSHKVMTNNLERHGLVLFESLKFKPLKGFEAKT